MVTKKRVKKVSSNTAKKEIKNIIAIVLGGLAILGSWVTPYNIILGLLSVVGIVLAYKEKGKSSSKLNKWAASLSIIGVSLTVIMLSLLIFALMQFAQLPQ